MRKLTTKEKILLGIVGASALLCVCILFLVVKLPEIREVQSRIGILEENIRNIKALEINEQDLTAYYDALKAGVAREKAGFYDAVERDLTALSLEMLSLLKKHRLNYTRLNKVDYQDGSYIEIALNGALVDIVAMLQEIYDRPKYLNISAFTLNNTSRTANATIRINYGEIAGLSD